MKSAGMTTLSITTFDHDPYGDVVVFLRIECAKWKHCWGISQAGLATIKAVLFVCKCRRMWYRSLCASINHTIYTNHIRWYLQCDVCLVCICVWYMFIISTCSVDDATLPCNRFLKVVFWTKKIQLIISRQFPRKAHKELGVSKLHS